MINKTLIALTLALFAGVATAALPFAEVDTNSDGMISPEEAAVVEGLDFDEADKNADKMLSQEEYTAATSE